MSSPTEFAAMIVDLPNKLLAFSDDPKTQMSLLFPLCEYTVTPVNTSAPIGAAENIITRATAALCRRSALSALCKAAAQWQADSWDEVLDIRKKISDLLNNEIIVATDDNNVATVSALRELRVKVLEQLAKAAGENPHLRSVERNAPLPALLIAQQLYTDGSRAVELIKRANPIHPAFMPTEFEALSS